MRALRALEQIGGDDARAILQRLATGNADSPLTREVKASLARSLSKSSKP
jgi:hypothetical protein